MEDNIFIFLAILIPVLLSYAIYMGTKSARQENAERQAIFARDQNLLRSAIHAERGEKYLASLEVLLDALPARLSNEDSASIIEVLAHHFVLAKGLTIAEPDAQIFREAFQEIAEEHECDRDRIMSDWSATIGKYLQGDFFPKLVNAVKGDELYYLVEQASMAWMVDFDNPEAHSVWINFFTNVIFQEIMSVSEEPA